LVSIPYLPCVFKLNEDLTAFNMSEPLTYGDLKSMCGIVAIVSQERPVNQNSLNAAVASLDHRGPDGRGTWTAPHGRTSLGHARLSIIDLQTGDQPIANEDERVWIVANGEFYDYERTQDELEKDGHRLRTRSDSEIALHLYEDLGTECVHQLRGEYAFTIWDERNQNLLAVRDRYGVKPLFYAVHDGALYVASEMKALFAAGVPARWDPESAYYGIGLRRQDRTPFLGVHSVPPGHLLLANRDGHRLIQYWDVEYPVRSEERRDVSDEEYVEEFRSLLDEAVRIRLRADVPVGCYLSGGLDSCGVLGMASLHRSDPIRAFTLSFEHADYDEGPIAEEMAAKAGAEFVSIPIRQDDLADNFSDSVYHAEAVSQNAHSVAKFVLSRAVRDAGFKVVITGEGADEILAGYPHFRQDMLLHDNDGQNPDEIEGLLKQLNESNKVSQGLLMSQYDGPGSALLNRLLPQQPAYFGTLFSRLERMEPLFQKDFFQPAEGTDWCTFLLSGLNLEGKVKGRSPVHQALYLWSKTSLPEYVLTVLGDRMEMAHSIEGRVPFLDHKLGEFVNQTPVNMKIRGMTEKFILREATKHVLTDTVYRRPKHPFISPPASKEPDNPKLGILIQDTLRSKVVDSVPFLDGKAVRNLVDSLDSMEPQQRFGIDSDLMILLCTVFMHERLGVAS